MSDRTIALGVGTRLGPYQIVANDPDRLARFSREAQMLAALNQARAVRDNCAELHRRRSAWRYSWFLERLSIICQLMRRETGR
jgi:hypothetical protein